MTLSVEKNILIDADEEEDMLVSQLNMDISNQYVVFTIGSEEYGVPILSVREIISLPNLKKVPRSPDFIGGIINLRGNIIPLYLLRNRFGLAGEELNQNSIVIIINTEDSRLRTVGFVVDSVSDVLSVTEEMISDMPEWNGERDNSYIEKIGKIGSRMIAMINLSGFFTEKEHKALEYTMNLQNPKGERNE